jgi:hypothetical protein
MNIDLLRDLQVPDNMPEEELLRLLADKVATIMKSGPEPFFQLMYRLDIPEKKLTTILFEADAPQQVARLIYERQLQKMKSRQEHKPNTSAEDEDLKW